MYQVPDVVHVDLDVIHPLPLK
jgi:hypothetical protein